MLTCKTCDGKFLPVVEPDESDSDPVTDRCGLCLTNAVFGRSGPLDFNSSSVNKADNDVDQALAKARGLTGE